MTQEISKSDMGHHSFEPSHTRFKALVAACADTVYSMSADWRVMNQLDGRGFLLDTKQPLTDWLKRYVPSHEIAKVQSAIEDAVKQKKMKTNTQIAKMTRMINDFLNVSRLESGKIHMSLPALRQIE